MEAYDLFPDKRRNEQVAYFKQTPPLKAQDLSRKSSPPSSFQAANDNHSSAPKKIEVNPEQAIEYFGGIPTLIPLDFLMTPEGIFNYIRNAELANNLPEGFVPVIIEYTPLAQAGLLNLFPRIEELQREGLLGRAQVNSTNSFYDSMKVANDNFSSALNDNIALVANDKVVVRENSTNDNFPLEKRVLNEKQTPIFQEEQRSVSPEIKGIERVLVTPYIGARMNNGYATRAQELRMHYQMLFAPANDNSPFMAGMRGRQFPASYSHGTRKFY